LQTARLGDWMRRLAKEAGPIEISEAGWSAHRNHFTNLKIRRLSVPLENGGKD
jgi:hypothetical protein